jgi:WD40 repeat protein
MAFGGYQRILTVVNLDRQEPPMLHETLDQIWSLAFRSNGQIVAGLGEGLVQVVHWDQERRSLDSRWVAKIEGAATHRAILPVMDGRLVVVASEEDRSLKLMNGAALLGCQLQPLQGTPLGTAAGDLIYVRKRAADINVSHGIHGPVKVNLGGRGRECFSVRSAATGLVAIADYHTIRLYDPSDWQLRKSFRPPAMPSRMSFSKNGRFLVGGCAEGMVWIQDLLTETCRELPRQITNWEAAVAFSPTEDLLVLGACGKRTLKLLKVPTFEEIAAVQTGSSIKALAFHPDGVRLAVAQDDAISIWDAQDVHGLRLLQVLQGRHGTVFSVAFSPNGRTLAGASSDGIDLWDVATGREFFTISAVPVEPSWIEFVDSTTLLAGSEKIWAIHRYGGPLDGERPGR